MQAADPTIYPAKAKGPAVPVPPAPRPTLPRLLGPCLCFSSCQGSSYPEAQAPWALSPHFLELVLGEGQAEITERGPFRAAAPPGTDPPLPGPSGAGSLPTVGAAMTSCWTCCWDWNWNCSAGGRGVTSETGHDQVVRSILSTPAPGCPPTRPAPARPGPALYLDNHSSPGCLRTKTNTELWGVG